MPFSSSPSTRSYMLSAKQVLSVSPALQTQVYSSDSYIYIQEQARWGRLVARDASGFIYLSILRQGRGNTCVCFVVGA